MKPKQRFGWMLTLIALVGLGLFILVFTTHRFAHPELTETQLMLWSLERWWGWLPATALGGVGLWLVRE